MNCYIRSLRESEWVPKYDYSYMCIWYAFCWLHQDIERDLQFEILLMFICVCVCVCLCVCVCVCVCVFVCVRARVR